MIFPINYPGVEENKRIAWISGFLPIDVNNVDVDSDTLAKVRPSRLKIFFSRFGFLQEIYYFFNEYKFLNKLRINFEVLLHDSKIDVLVLPAQNRFHFPYFAELAKVNHIPVIVAPDWFAGKYELVESLQGSKFHNIAIPRFMLRIVLGKQFVISNPFDTKRSLIPFRISDIILRRYFGITSDDPWTLHSGFSDAILCESEWAKEFAISLGLSANNLFVTGSIAHDEMFFSTTEVKKPKDSYVVIAIPPDMFSSNKHKNLEFSDFTEMLNFLIDSVKDSCNLQIIASPHPSLSHEQVDSLSKKGIKIAQKGIHLELANASFFVASISATIQWAMAIQIPVINYDLYKFDYPDYLRVPGVVKCEIKADFLEKLEIFSQTATKDNLRKFSGTTYYGEVDGRAIDRIETLMRSLFQNWTLKHE
jgi:hypothetical protein